MCHFLYDIFIYFKFFSQENLKKKIDSWPSATIEQKGMTFDHDFYVVVGKQCRTENAYAGLTNTISLYKLTNVF